MTDVGQAYKQHAQARSANCYTSILCSYTTGISATEKDVSSSVSISAEVINQLYGNVLRKMSSLFNNISESARSEIGLPLVY